MVLAVLASAPHCSEPPSRGPSRSWPSPASSQHSWA